MAEAQKPHIHLGLLIVGILFFIVHIIVRYYLILVLDPQGAVTFEMVSIRDSIFQIGIIVSAASLILPSANFPKDESNIISYIFFITTIFFTLGLYLNSIGSAVDIYIVYNSGIVLTILSAAILLAYLGFRGKRIRSEETERIATAALALILLLNLVLALWIFSVESSGRQVSVNWDILRDHSLRYAIWMVLATFIMKFSDPSKRLYRLTVLGLLTATLIWTLTFIGYTLGASIQILSGIMDSLLGATILATLLSLWGLKGKRGRITAHFITGSVALIWFIIAGAVGLYMIAFFSIQGLIIPSTWRLFHLMNANWALVVGLGAVALASIRNSGRLCWIVALLFSASIVKTIVTYLVNIFDPNTARGLLILGEPFLLIGFLVVLYLLIKDNR